jgi:hypothetical protein
VAAVIGTAADVPTWEVPPPVLELELSDADGVLAVTDVVLDDSLGGAKGGGAGKLDICACTLEARRTPALQMESKRRDFIGLA